MIKTFILILVLTISVFSQTINFDDPAKWTQGSGPFDTYQDNHEYVDYVNGVKILFRGKDAKREESGTLDGVPLTYNNSVYAWNLKEGVAQQLFIRIEAPKIDGFSFYVRRRTANPNPRYFVTYSYDGGFFYNIIGLIDNNFLNNSDDWIKYSHPSLETGGTYPPDFLLIKIEAFPINYIENSGGINIDDFVIDNPLPVELVTFGANVEGNIVELKWKTATELNNYGFEIYRAAEEKDWEKIGFVEGYGNSNSPKEYSFVDENIEKSGEYIYRLKQIDIDGSFEYSPVVDVFIDAPDKFELSQNYPNPFNPITTIKYSIPSNLKPTYTKASVDKDEISNVRLVVYDVLGREVAVLVNKQQLPGNYTVSFNASELNSGIYLYQLTAGEFSSIRKMMLIK